MTSSSSQSPSSPSADQPHPVRTKRRYGASCQLCRRRKRKCPGRDSQGNSLCTHCGEVGVNCVFPPNGSFLRAKKTVNVINSIAPTSEADNLRAYIGRLASVNEQERQRMLNQWMDDGGESIKDAVRRLPPKLAPKADSNEPEEDDEEEEEDKFSLRSSRPPSSKDPRPSKKPRLWSEAAPQQGEDEEDDEEQSVETSLRPESALRLSLKPATPEDPEATGDDPRPDRSNQSTNHLQASISGWVNYWVSLPFPNGITADGPSREDRKLLFDNYFCWQGPRNGIVDRAIFERALEENDTRYYSPFLLYSLCAHTVRHIPSLRDRVHEYAAKAHYLLAVELSRPSSIPTVQGLMLLASHDAARGMYAQAWTFSSSAIAMMIDLGCHLEKPTSQSDRGDSKNERRNTIHRQMRLRMFWSTFIWDKYISLALNRTPLLSSEQHAPPYPDTPSSSELWIPVLCADSPPALFSYVPQPSYELECFYETCRANQFLDEIHRKMYRSQKVRSPQTREFVADMRERMLRWQTEACSNVMLDLNKPPLVYPPPPHIMQLNLLVRLMWILLYRPFYYSSANADSSSSSFVPHAVETCQKAAWEINALFILYDRYYPLSRASYIAIFAAFLQATVDLALADREKSVSGAILSRLALAGRVLSGGSINIPGMFASVRRLQRHLHATLSRYVTTSSKPRKDSDGDSSERNSAIAKELQDISPSPSNQHSSIPLGSQSDPSLTLSSISTSPLSSASPEGTDLTPLSPQYPLLAPTHPSPVLSNYGRGMAVAEGELGTSEYLLTGSEGIYPGGQAPYTPPEQEVVDYMMGSSLSHSHYEGGWNAWFWPGEGSSAYGSGSTLQTLHTSSV